MEKFRKEAFSASHRIIIREVNVEEEVDGIVDADNSVAVVIHVLIDRISLLEHGFGITCISLWAEAA